MGEHVRVLLECIDIATDTQGMTNNDFAQRYFRERVAAIRGEPLPMPPPPVEDRKRGTGMVAKADNKANTSN